MLCRVLLDDRVGRTACRALLGYWDVVKHQEVPGGSNYLLSRNTEPIRTPVDSDEVMGGTSNTQC